MSTIPLHLNPRTISVPRSGNGRWYSDGRLLTMVSSVTQYGITWQFDGDYEVGQYANGDNFVVGKDDGAGGTEVGITSITPDSVEVEETGFTRVINGTMVNPYSGQGWDTAGNETIAMENYTDGLNVHPSRTGTSLVLEEGTVVSCISREDIDNISGIDRGRIQTYALLTVVKDRPAQGSFRPDPYGTDKQSYWVENDIDYSMLRSLEPVDNTPSMSSATNGIHGFWNDHVDGPIFRSQGARARDFQTGYGREVGYRSGDALLSAHLNYTNAEKRDLVVHMIQKGIDMAGAQELGGDWENNGGHYASEKFRMMFSGMLLNDTRIKGLCDASVSGNFVHGCDQQTFVVTQEDVDRESCNSNDPNTTSGNPCGTTGASLYESSDLGLPEWGRAHHTAACTFDCRDWNISYRDNASSSVFGNALAILLIQGAKEAWGHDALFDYMDRFYEIENTSGTIGGANNIQTFHANMYSAYRSLGPAIWSDE